MRSQCSIIIFLTALLLRATASHKTCCPPGVQLDLHHYECENTTDTSRFPKCRPDEVFINVPLANVAEPLAEFREFCLANSEAETVVACANHTNLNSLLKEKMTIPKCCGMFHKRARGMCVPATHRFESAFFDLKDVNVLDIQCKSLDLLNEEEYGNVTLLSNGSLLVEKPKLQILTAPEFCFENVKLTFACMDHAEAPKPSNQPIDQSWVDLLVSVGLIISVVFLMATFLIYACELNKQNLYGKTLMCHIGSVTVAFSCLATVQLFTNAIYTPLCTNVIPYLMMLAFHAAFFWLNVMSIDIWRTFRSIRSIDNIRRNRRMLRFTMYSIYAWGVPIILTILTLIAVELPVLPRVISPVIEFCWLSREDYGYHLFFIAPIACVILSNVIMYVTTAYRCHQVKKEINTMHYADKGNKDKFSKNKEQLVLNVKLFLVMGLTWSMEVISYLAKRQTKNPSLRFLWYLPDIMNSLYGLILFVIFALKKKNIRRVTRQVSTWIHRRRTETEDLRKISTSVNPSSVNNTLIDTTILDGSH